jgi:hypothetical protein
MSSFKPFSFLFSRREVTKTPPTEEGTPSSTRTPSASLEKEKQRKDHRTTGSEKGIKTLASLSFPSFLSFFMGRKDVCGRKEGRKDICGRKNTCGRKEGRKEGRIYAE